MSKKRNRILLGVIMGIVLVCSILAFVASRSGNLSLTLPVKHKPAYEADTGAFPPVLTAQGNRLVDPGGQAVTLHGLMPQDPAKMRSNGQFNRAFFEQMRATGANVVRLPVHPERWERDPDYLWRNLDPAVTWAGELGMYAIIDLHFIGNVATGAGDEMPDIKQKPMQLSLDFWEQTAAYFRAAPHVIFEICNEPAAISAEEWRASASEMVSAIRATGAKQLIIVGSPEYSRTLNWTLHAPLADANLAFAAHIYPGHSRSMWDVWFGDVARTYPVLVTEWGFMDENRDEAPSYLVGTQVGYGEPFLDYLQARGIGWVACWYNHQWLPQMFKDKQMSMHTRFGAFVLDRLKSTDSSE